jgi:hypothetical protein
LPEQLIHQGCFAVIDVGDDGDISDFMLEYHFMVSTGTLSVMRQPLLASFLFIQKSSLHFIFTTSGFELQCSDLAFLAPDTRYLRLLV